MSDPAPATGFTVLAALTQNDMIEIVQELSNTLKTLPDVTLFRKMIQVCQERSAVSDPSANLFFSQLQNRVTTALQLAKTMSAQKQKDIVQVILQQYAAQLEKGYQPSPVIATITDDKLEEEMTTPSPQVALKALKPQATIPKPSLMDIIRQPIDVLFTMLQR